jgi:hypothetical protein
MPAFDSGLALVDGSAAWTYAALVTPATYGVPTSTTRNAGGFAVLDIGETGVDGLSAVVILPAANAGADALTLTIEGCASAAFGSLVHVLADFDIVATTTGVLVGSETPCVMIRRFRSKWRYIRAHAVVTAADDFGLGKVYLHNSIGWVL